MSRDRYAKPGWFTRNVVNRIVSGLTRAGVSVWGSRVLEVPGRTTGEPRRTPVNLLELDGSRYLVAPRGHTQWVRNMRVSGGVPCCSAADGSRSARRSSTTTPSRRCCGPT